MTKGRLSWYFWISFSITRRNREFCWRAATIISYWLVYIFEVRSCWSIVDCRDRHCRLQNYLYNFSYSGFIQRYLKNMRFRSFSRFLCYLSRGLIFCSRNTWPQILCIGVCKNFTPVFPSRRGKKGRWYLHLFRMPCVRLSRLFWKRDRNSFGRPFFPSLSKGLYHCLLP